MIKIIELSFFLTAFWAYVIGPIYLMLKHPKKIYPVRKENCKYLLLYFIAIPAIIALYHTINIIINY